MVKIVNNACAVKFADEVLVGHGNRPTSVPVSRKAHRARKYKVYSDFKWFRFCAHIDVHDTSFYIVYCGHL